MIWRDMEIVGGKSPKDIPLFGNIFKGRLGICVNCFRQVRLIRLMRITGLCSMVSMLCIFFSCDHFKWRMHEWEGVDLSGDSGECC